MFRLFKKGAKFSSIIASLFAISLIPHLILGLIPLTGGLNSASLYIAYYSIFYATSSYIFLILALSIVSGNLSLYTCSLPKRKSLFFLQIFFLCLASLFFLSLGNTNSWFSDPRNSYLLLREGKGLVYALFCTSVILLSFLSSLGLFLSRRYKLLHSLIIISCIMFAYLSGSKEVALRCILAFFIGSLISRYSYPLDNSNPLTNRLRIAKRAFDLRRTPLSLVPFLMVLLVFGSIFFASLLFISQIDLVSYFDHSSNAISLYQLKPYRYPDLELRLLLFPHLEGTKHYPGMLPWVSIMQCSPSLQIFCALRLSLYNGLLTVSPLFILFLPIRFPILRIIVMMSCMSIASPFLFGTSLVLSYIGIFCLALHILSSTKRLS